MVFKQKFTFMKKVYFFPLLFFLIWPDLSLSQTIELATNHFDKLDKIADVATEAFFEYANARFLNKSEKVVSRKKKLFLDVLESQEKKIANEKPFNGQMRLKNGYFNLLGEIKQFPENLGPYTQVTNLNYQTGQAQKSKKDFLLQLEILKTAANELNQEVQKYIILNKLKDFRKNSIMPGKWNKAIEIHSYSQKIQESVLSVGALQWYFTELMRKDSIDKAEKIQAEILQKTAAFGPNVKIRPPQGTDFSLREAAVNSINIYRMDAFRNFKTMIGFRRKEMAFQKKYTNIVPGQEKNEALKNKFEKEKVQVEADLSLVKNLVKEMKKDWEKLESAFDENLNQYLEKWTLAE